MEVLAVLVLGLLVLLGLAGLLAYCCNVLNLGEPRLPGRDVEAQREQVILPTLDLEKMLGRSFMKHSVTKHLMPTCSSAWEAEEFSRMRDARDKEEGRQETVVNTVFRAEAEDFDSKVEMIDGESVQVENAYLDIKNNPTTGY